MWRLDQTKPHQSTQWVSQGVKGDVRGVPSGGRLLRRMGSREALGVSPGVKGLYRGFQVVKGYVRCPRALRWTSRGSQVVREEVLSVQ